MYTAVACPTRSGTMRKTSREESVGCEPTARSKDLLMNRAYVCSVGCHAGDMTVPVDTQEEEDTVRN